MKRLLLALAAVTAAAPVAGADETATPQQFVMTYCLDCHNADYSEGDRAFDALTAADAGPAGIDADQFEQWQEILDRLNLGDMPPEDAGVHPSGAERLAMIGVLTRRLGELADADAPTVALRRLSHAQYDRTVRSLLGLEAMLADPTDSFSPNETDEGFATVGESMVVSDFLMSRYLAAADAYLDAAIERAQPLPAERSWTLHAPFSREWARPDGQNRDGEYQHIRENASDNEGYIWLQKLWKQLPAAGQYRIRVRACGLNRDYPYKEQIIRVPKADPQVLSIVASDAETDTKPNTAHATDRELATFEVTDRPAWYEATVSLDRMSLLKLGYPNGPHKVKYMRHRLMREHRESFPRFLTECVPVFSDMHPDYDKVEGPKLAEAFLAEQEELKQAGKPYAVFGIGNLINGDDAWLTFFEEYRGPRIRVFEAQVDGPVGRPESPDFVAVLVDDTLDADRRRELIREFTTAAYRRDPTAAEWRALVELDARLRQTESPTAAARVVFKAVLCSPGLLYQRTDSGPLDDYDLATRLAYFLTGSPPDDRLLTLAAEGTLSQAHVLRAEAERLLTDADRSSDFIDELADAWLHLSKLGTMLPDRSDHPDYYNERLQTAMLGETLAFLADAIAEDRGVRWLVEADRTYLNAPLARLYGLNDAIDVDGLELRPVQLPDRRRGGLLTQASILTASANGIDTSPVRRGMWVLECLLGTPPPPPPPDIEPIEPDIRGATTIREQLARHRDVVSCRACHQRIDPLGFALESFDEIGRSRERYNEYKWADRNRDKPPVDASGKLPSGETFDDVAGLQSLLAERDTLIRQNYVRKLMTLATGRLHDRADAAETTRIAADVRGMKSLLLAVVGSEAFRR